MRAFLTPKKPEMHALASVLDTHAHQIGCAFVDGRGGGSGGAECGAAGHGHHHAAGGVAVVQRDVQLLDEFAGDVVGAYDVCATNGGTGSVLDDGVAGIGGAGLYADLAVAGVNR